MEYSNIYSRGQGHEPDWYQPDSVDNRSYPESPTRQLYQQQDRMFRNPLLGHGDTTGSKPDGEHEMNENEYIDENDNQSVSSVVGDRIEYNNDADDGKEITNAEVLQRIESIVTKILLSLDKYELPTIETYTETNSSEEQYRSNTITKRFTLNQCRSFTSVMLVAAFCHSLILARRTTTNREVYYFYVTHFKSQRECDAAIADLCLLIQVPRHMLNLMASPKGWFCGDIQLISNNPNDCRSNNRNERRNRDDDHVVVLDGRSLPSIHGAPISSEWLLPASRRNFTPRTVAATCILVVEKEGVYNRLSEDKFYEQYPCIIVTGKGFPDYATRAMVATLHKELQLPVRGLADCNPFGVMVLNTYRYHASSRVQRQLRGQYKGGYYESNGSDTNGIPIEWIGLRPSQVSHIMKVSNKKKSQSDVAIVGPTFPPEVFQELTSLDEKRLFETLLNDDHVWTNYGQNEQRIHELYQMQHYKVELEAMNWLGMDYITNWLGTIFEYNSDNNSCTTNVANNRTQYNEGKDEGDDDGSDDNWLQII